MFSSAATDDSSDIAQLGLEPRVERNERPVFPLHYRATFGTSTWRLYSLYSLCTQSLSDLVELTGIEPVSEINTNSKTSTIIRLA